MRFREFCENQSALYQQLYSLRPLMAQAAQTVYNEWDQEDEFCDYGDGGICDEIAREIGGIIVQNIAGVELTDGGMDGDDHAYNIVYNDTEAYAVDIPAHVYERGGGYSWQKIPGVTITADDVVIEAVDRRHVTGDHW